MILEYEPLDLTRHSDFHLLLLFFAPLRGAWRFETFYLLKLETVTPFFTRRKAFRRTTPISKKMQQKQKTVNLEFLFLILLFSNRKTIWSQKTNATIPFDRAQPVSCCQPCSNENDGKLIFFNSRSISLFASLLRLRFSYDFEIRTMRSYTTHRFSTFTIIFCAAARGLEV